MSNETAKMMPVSAPVLLDGNGAANLEDGAEPYVFRFQAYPTTTFPVEFYNQEGVQP